MPEPEVAVDLSPGQEAKLACKGKPPWRGRPFAQPDDYISLEVVGGPAVGGPDAPVGERPTG